MRALLEDAAGQTEEREVDVVSAVRVGKLVEAGDDNLTFFEHDFVCEGCAVNHGVL